MKPQVLKKIFSRSVWTLLAIFFLILMLIAIVGGNVAYSHEAAINGVLNLNPWEQVEDGDANENTEYFASDFMKDGKYDDQAMRANSEEVALQAAVEGSVLLWNDEQALPLAENAGVSLFGVSQANYAFLGDGSGGMSVTPPDSLRSAFSKYGLNLNSELFLKYSELSGKYKRSHRYAANEAPYSEVSETVDKTIANYSDAAVMIVSRVAGEHHDILPTGSDEFLESKNYLELSADEADVLSHLTELKKQGKVKKVVLLINSTNALQFKHIRNDFDIDACVWVGMGGTMSYEQIAMVLSNRGDYVLSGHLPDTSVYDNYSHPSQQNFGDFTWNEYSQDLPDLDNQGKETYATFNIKYIAYQEGIYVGYRYYETRYEDTVLGQGKANSTAGAYNSDSGWKYEQEVAFPFGYGLAYTTFSYSQPTFTTNEDGDYVVSLEVENTGSVSGKDAVQVYLQKPYTDYDRENGIEQSAIELVGFDKTGLIKPGEKEKVEIVVDAEQMKTYDSNNKGTYILEKGDYYLSVGQDSHEAINNILAAKGYSTDDGMTSAGNNAFTHKITIAEDDFEKYSVSSTTGNPIVNQFDDVDLNKYEGTKDDQSIVYLSRNDWEGTYPETVILDCVNETMVADMQYGKEVVSNPEDEMPVYDTVTSPVGKLTLAMLMDKEYDDELWQHLLNQMTVEEQQYLISYGLHHIAGAVSVGAPGCESKDGPAGLKEPNPTLGTTFSFPSEVNLAATFDVELIETLGIAFGHEILHADYNVIYAPGGCIHRSPYGGRNWEYFSEDGFLSGKMLSHEVTGLQKKGVIVFTKHFALNDQEENRYGVSTWANEQSIRELYLEPFELAVVEGKMNGVMSSFNRIGCTWTGAHKGLLTEVLRNEWGFVGVVETDSCTGTTDSVHHMTNPLAKANGLMAGNDLWMDGGGNTSYLKEHLDNPTVMLALREACHRILYAQLHSNAMNGISSSTRIVRKSLWWQDAILAIRVVSIILFVLCTLMAVLSFLYNTKWCSQLLLAFQEKIETNRKKKAEVQNIQGEGSSSSSDPENPNDGNKDRKKRNIFIVTIASVALVAVILAIVLPITLGGSKSSSSNTGPDNSSTTPSDTTPEEHVCNQKCPTCGLCLDMDCTDPACEEKCGEGKEEHVFEAEDAKLIEGQKALNIATNGGNTFVGEFNDNLGAAIELTITSDTDATATLIATVSRRRVETVLTSNLMVTVNDKEIASPAIVPDTGTGEEGWYDFVDVRLGCVSLVAGENSIRFTQMNKGDISGYNFDKIKLLVDAELTYVAPVYECNAICPVCGKCMDPDCKNADHADKCGIKGGTRYQFEAENATFLSGTKGSPKSEHSDKYPDDQYVMVGNLSENVGAGLSYKVYAREETTVNLTAAVSMRSASVLFNDGYTITVNGEPVVRTSTVPAANPDSPSIQGNGNDWLRSTEINLGCVTLKKGENTILFSVASNNPGTCFNFDYIVLTSLVELSEKQFNDVKKTGIEITSLPGQLTYFVGDTLNTAGLVVSAVYEDGTKTPLNASEYTVSPTGPLQAEDKKVVITHETFTTSFEITVSERPAKTYRLEAENAAVTDGTKKVKVDKTLGLIGELSANLNASFSFTFSAEEAGKASLILAANERATDSRIGDFLKIDINGTEVPTEAVIPGSEYHQIMWYSFVEATLAEIDLAKGDNTITFTVKTADDIGFNVDYVKLITNETIAGDILAHSCQYKCPICGKCTNLYCTDYDACKEKCGGDHELSYRYEAEKAVLGEGDNKGMPNIRDNFVDNVNGNPNATLTFTVTSSKEQRATLSASVSTKNARSLLFTEEYAITVNGTSVTSPSRVPISRTNADIWHRFTDVLIGCIELKEGENTIVLTATSEATNIDYIELSCDNELTNNPGCTHKCPTCGKCVDPDCHATSCKDKCNHTGEEHVFTSADATLVNGTKELKIEGNGAIGNVDENKGAQIIFTITSDKETTAGLSLRVNYRQNRKVLTDGLGITINDRAFSSPAIRPASERHNNDWNTFVDVYLGCVSLKQGENTIVLTVLTGTAGDCSNIMSISFFTDAVLTSAKAE